MKKEFFELQELDKKIKSQLNTIKSIPDSECETNTIKVLKYNLFEKASKTFNYNLKKLIQLESTQRSLAKKIGVSEDLLSKYKTGEAFPSIETLLYICEVYKISLSKLINDPFSAEDIDNLEYNQDYDFNVFEERYYAYFLVTNIGKEGAIHEGIIQFSGDDVIFKILYNDKIVKGFLGGYNITNKLIYFNLQSSVDGNAYITMLKPNVNKKKYVGGLAMLMLSSDANSKPCVQKILLSKIRLNRELHYNKLKDLLNFYSPENSFGNIKISQTEDEAVYNFLESL